MIKEMAHSFGNYGNAVHFMVVLSAVGYELDCNNKTTAITHSYPGVAWNTKTFCEQNTTIAGKTR